MSYFKESIALIFVANTVWQCNGGFVREVAHNMHRYGSSFTPFPLHYPDSFDALKKKGANFRRHRVYANLISLEVGSSSEQEGGSSNFGDHDDAEECVFDYDNELFIGECLPESEVRKARKEQERIGRIRFAKGDKLVELRGQIAKMYDLLDVAKETNYQARISALTEAIASAERKDPELAYARALDECAGAEEAGDIEKSAYFWQEAKSARENIAQLNLHGMWVGKYGSSGYQMVNVTYVGDTLIATKLTGDKNVPRGEVTFVADLSPHSMKKQSSKGGAKPLEPIELSNGAAKKWGTTSLQRYHGKGQIASEKFADAQWVEGQLIMVGEYFSFAWVPIGHQIFFGRPSLELTLKMLKEGTANQDGMDDVRAQLKRAYDESEEVHRLDQQIYLTDIPEDGLGVFE